MKKTRLVLFIFVLLWTIKLPAENTTLKLYLDPSYSSTGEDVRITLDSFLDAGFPSPKNNLPVLFIHDGSTGDGENFRKNWQQTLDGLPSFRETLKLPANARLGIEPYYIDLHDPSNPGEIKEAVGLILFHQGDPAAKKKKVVIIALGSGAVPARLYLKDLWESQNRSLAFQPVSEFIAISPPASSFLTDGPAALDIKKTDYHGQLFASEAPGSRASYEGVENGILYVTLYPEGQKDRKNLAPDAVNIEVTGIPTGSADTIAHMPEVICKALYTAVNHSAPPHAFTFENAVKDDPKSPPIIPPFQMSEPREGFVLLLDISGSMSGYPASAQQIARGFLELLPKTRNKNTTFGMVVFPSLPWNRVTKCDSHVIFPMTPVSETAVADAAATLDDLTVNGATPLLNGLDTALHMFAGEKRKTIILISDGNVNCPADVYPGDPALKKSLEALADKGVKLYTVGTGSLLDGWANGINGLIEPARRGPAAEAASVFAEALDLEQMKETGEVSAVRHSHFKMFIHLDKSSYVCGDTITLTAAVSGGTDPAAHVTGMTVKVTQPVEGAGNWYAANKTGGPEFRTVPAEINGDTVSQLERKALYLSQTGKIPLPGEKTTVALQLYDDGSNGDEKKGDGIYTFQFKDTVKPGPYAFHVEARGENFTMEKTARTEVAVQPDPLYSKPVVRWNDLFHDREVQYGYEVSFTPMDRWGNYLGPGHNAEVRVLFEQDEENNFTLMLDDNLNGNYVGTLNIPRVLLKTGTRLVFTIDGKPVSVVEKVPRFQRWSLGISAGGNFPDNFYRNYTHPGFSFGCNAGYRLSPEFSLVALLGYNGFRGRSGAAVKGEKLWWNTSLNLVSEILKEPFRVYFNAGFGFYFTENGDMENGSNAGVGGSYSLKPGWVLEVGADLHRIYLKGIDTDFLVTYIRLVHRF